MLLYLFRLFPVSKLCKSGLCILHYNLEELKYAKVVYIGLYLILTYIERSFLIVCYFLSYFCQSVNFMSSVSKFHNFFPTCWEIEKWFIFEVFFQYCCLWKFQFQFSSSFLAFLMWSVHCSSHFLSQFLLLINCMS